MADDFFAFISRTVGLAGAGEGSDLDDVVTIVPSVRRKERQLAALRGALVGLYWCDNAQ